MKKLFFSFSLLLIFAPFVLSQTQTKGWVFSDQVWMQQNVFTQATVVDGLTVMAKDSSDVTIESTNKTHYGPTGPFVFTRMLRLGGIGQPLATSPFLPTTRAVAFDVSGPGKIEIACLSSSTESKKLIISNGTEWLSSVTAQSTNYIDSIGNQVPLFEYNYTGGPARIYMYSVDGTVDLYSLKTENFINDTIPVFQNVTFNVRVPAGTKECWIAGSFNNWDNGVNQMVRVDSLNYTLVVPNVDMTNLRYKYLSGPRNWGYVEKGTIGEEIDNRYYQLTDTVRSWAAIYDSTTIISKNITFEVMVPSQVQTMRLAGSFNGWDPAIDSTLMVLKSVSPNGKIFSKTVFVSDINLISYKYVAGPAWEYVQTQDNEFSYQKPGADTIRNNVFGFYKYYGTDVQPRDWNFSKDPFKEVRQFTSFVNQWWLLVMGTTDAPISVDQNTKVNGQNNFAFRLKMGGAAQMNAQKPNLPIARALALKVGGDCQIALSCLSASSLENRELIISNGDSILGRIPAPGKYSQDGNTVPMTIFNYQGPATPIYLYSATGGVNLYYVGVSNNIQEVPYEEPGMTYTVKVPQGTNEVWIAGDFNGWSPASNNMNRIDSVTFQITILGATSQQGYKFLSGPDWQYCEVAANGNEIPNRTWSQLDVVERWANTPTVTKIYYENILTSIGENFTLTVKSTSNHPLQPIAYQFELNYDPYLMEYTGYTTNGTISSIGEIVVNSTSSWGRLYISFMSSESFNAIGDLLKLNFHVNNSVYYYDTSCGISNFYYDNNQIWQTESGNIHIMAYRYGDIDGNQMIQAYDAALALQYSVGKDPLPLLDPLPWEDWRLKAANVDGIEGITANDAAMILQYSAYLINVFDVERDSTLMRAPANRLADVTITQEGNNLVFKSFGNMVGLNVYLQDQFNMLGEPVISKNIDLSAINRSNSVYAVGLAALRAPDEGSIIMTVPILNNNSTDLIFRLIVNTEQKDVIVSAQATTGVNSITDAGISLYPNPVSDIIHLTNIVPGSRIAIYDISGRVFYNQNAKTNMEQINVSTLKSGLYTISVSNDKINTVSKFIKK